MTEVIFKMDTQNYDWSFMSMQIPMTFNFLFHKKFKRKGGSQLDRDPGVDAIFL